MNHKVRVWVALALLCTGAIPVSEAAYSQQVDFGKIDKFESLTTGTLRVDAPPKTIVDDGELATSPIYGFMQSRKHFGRLVPFGI